jgi:hypothetical protein
MNLRVEAAGDNMSKKGGRETFPGQTCPAKIDHGAKR